MNEEHIQPFLQETVNTFEMMLGIQPSEEDLEIKSTPDSTFDVSAIIGISGSGSGGVVISFPADTACKIVSQMLGETLSEVNQDVTDGIGELINIITGNAKRALVKHGFDDLSLSLPNVVIGSHRTVWRSKDMPCLMKKFFISKLGPFSLEVNLRSNKPA